MNLKIEEDDGFSWFDGGEMNGSDWGLKKVMKMVTPHAGSVWHRGRIGLPSVQHAGGVLPATRRRRVAQREFLGF